MKVWKTRGVVGASLALRAKKERKAEGSGSERVYLPYETPHYDTANLRWYFESVLPVEAVARLYCQQNTRFAVES